MDTTRARNTKISCHALNFWIQQNYKFNPWSCCPPIFTTLTIHYHKNSYFFKLPHTTMVLLRHQHTHRSKYLNDTAIDCYHSFNIEEPHQLIKPYVERAGFGIIATIGRFKVDPTLVTAMVERWRPETHTFHLPVGECTITLQDVALQLGLPVGGDVVTGDCVKRQPEWDDECEKLLGMPRPTDQRRGFEVKMKWLKEAFAEIPEGASSIVLRQHCRAYLLRLIGGFICPDKSSNRVHLKYLLLLKNLRQTSQYSWGSACLATLYREMCKAATGSIVCMGGCTLLLQSWAWYRMPFLAPFVNRPPEWPLAKRWVGGGLDHRRCPGDLVGYRTRIDHMTQHEFLWLPYQEIQYRMPQDAFHGSDCWSANTALICFQFVEWHQADRVKLQFGLLQDIPAEPIDLDSCHSIDMRGQSDVNWEFRHRGWIQFWNERRNKVVVGQPFYGKPMNSETYMDWFRQNSVPYLSVHQHLRDPRGGDGAVDHQVEDEQTMPEAPPGPTTQTERRIRNRGQRWPNTHQNIEEPMPSRHSVSYTPTYQEYQSFNQSVENTPFQDTHRRSIAGGHDDMFFDCFGVYPGTPESVAYLRSLQEQAGASSSSYNQYEQPPPPAQTDEEIPAAQQRPRRNRRPPPCGTGHHLHR